MELLTESPLRPVLRLFDHRAGEIDVLLEVCASLSRRTISKFALHEQPWMTAADGCRFTWVLGMRDVGVKMAARDQPFVMECSKEAWPEVEEKLRSVREPQSRRWNWLTMEGDVGVLVSFDGLW